MEEAKKNSISTKEKNLRKYLGDSDFENLAQFIARTGLYELAKNMSKNRQDEETKADQTNKAHIVAFATQRCYILALEYMKIFLDYCKENKEPDFLDMDSLQMDEKEQMLYVTDSTLIEMADELVLYYFKYNTTPTIDIVSELLIHGCTINNLLFNLEEKMLERLDVRYKEKEQSVPSKEIKLDILHKLRDNIRILVYVRSDSLLLLYPCYRLQLESVHTLDAYHRRLLSEKISIALAHADSSNTTYSWTLRVKKDTDSYTLLNKIIFNQQEKYEKNFNCVQFGENTNRRIYLRVYGTLENPKVIGVIQVRRSQTTEDLLITSYMLTGAMPLEGQNILFSKWQMLLKDFSNIIPQGDLVSPCRKQELNLMLLGKLMFEDWLNEILNQNNISVKMKDFVLDDIQFLGNFMTQQLDTQSLKNYDSRWNKAVEETQELLKRSLMNENKGEIVEQIKDCLNKSKPIWMIKTQCEDNRRELDENELFQLNKILEDTITNIVYEREKNLFDLKCNTTKDEETCETSRNDKELALNNFVEEVFKKIPQKFRGEKSVLECIVARLIYMMDIGIITIAPKQNINENGCIFLNVHMNEVALFIKPSRCEKYIIVLSAISSVYKDDPDLILPEIKRFVRAAADNPAEGMNICKEFGGYMKPDEIAKELYSFVNQVKKAGNNLKSWKFPLTDFSCQLNEKNTTGEDIWEVLKAQVDYLSIYRRAAL